MQPGEITQRMSSGYLCVHFNNKTRLQIKCVDQQQNCQNMRKSSGTGHLYQNPITRYVMNIAARNISSVHTSKSTEMNVFKKKKFCS